MYHIGEVPGVDGHSDPTAKPQDHWSNRKLIQANLYSLCLNMLMEEESDDGDGAA